ncbi:MAG: FMN-binding protein [Desulfovibrio sp.]|nr:FMN-binding protein [Desulfovibrio sp.]
MKKLAALCLSMVVCMALLTGTALADKYKPGTYKGSAKGYSTPQHAGRIEVEVTVDANAIKDIKLVAFEQTDKGAQAEFVAQAKDKIPAEIVGKQSLNVESVAKASASSMGIELAVAQCLEQATVAYKDGTYKGKAVGYQNPSHPGEIEVEVTIAGGKISNIAVPTFHQTEQGKQGELSAEAKNKIPGEIVAKQSVAVDSVAKASMSSDGIKLAVARALEQAR